jgi:hypothetical protein
LKRKFEKIVELGRVLQPTFHNYELNRTFHLTFAFYKKKCMSIGVNSIKTHPNIKKLNYMSKDGEDLRNIARMHSELNCVLKLQKKIDIDNFRNIIFVNIYEVLRYVCFVSEMDKQDIFISNNYKILF